MQGDQEFSLCTVFVSFRSFHCCHCLLLLSHKGEQGGRIQMNECIYLDICHCNHAIALLYLFEYVCAVCAHPRHSHFKTSSYYMFVQWFTNKVQCNSCIQLNNSSSSKRQPCTNYTAAMTVITCKLCDTQAVSQRLLLLLLLLLLLQHIRKLQWPMNIIIFVVVAAHFALEIVAIHMRTFIRYILLYAVGIQHTLYTIGSSIRIFNSKFSRVQVKRTILYKRTHTHICFNIYYNSGIESMCARARFRDGNLIRIDIIYHSIPACSTYVSFFSFVIFNEKAKAIQSKIKPNV